MTDKNKIQSLTYELLKAIGENPEREGLKDTPRRIAEMCEEIFSGVNTNPENFVKLFKEDSQTSDIVEINDIPVYSVCEHHLLPFFGKANIKYIPKDGNIMGISKFPRIVNCFAAKPQVQERLTREIAEFLFNKLNPQGIKVTLECSHMCMIMRGIKAQGSMTKTTSVFGNIE